MRNLVLRIAVLVLALAAMVSCGKGRIIPAGTMADIYADMFIYDQWLRDHTAERKAADTLLFYEPIFKRYGYTFKDYDATVSKYLKDPERFAKVFRQAGEQLKERKKYYEGLRDRYKEINESNAAIRGFVDKDFEGDTVIWQPLYETENLDSVLIEYAWSDTLKAREARAKLEKKGNAKRRDGIRADKK